MHRRAFLGGLLSASALRSQQYSAGPQVLTFFSPIDDSDQPYALYLPKNYSADRRWPLVVSLHGAGSNHRLNLRRVFGRGNRPGEQDGQASRYFPALPDVEMIVASPLARGTMGYQTIAERDVYDMLADVRKRFSVDEDRIYLTGLSMGGGGALWLGLTRPDLWAAIAPVCPAAPEEAIELAGNALNTPVRLFQGAIDPVVPAASTRAWHARLRDFGVRAEYVEYPGVRHNSWDHAYKDGSIFAWFAEHKLDRNPSRVQFSTRSYRHSSAWWLRFDRLTPGELASADARISGKTVAIATRNLDAFTLTLTGSIQSVTIDGKAIRIRPRTPLSFSKTARGWAAAKSIPGEGEKRQGFEGPISDAISSRHIYVHGAGTREFAVHAAEWSTPRSRLQLHLRVMADKDVTDADLQGANLVLFGTRATNSLLERYADRLPLHLNPGAADYGLVYVYPVDGRYIVVSSGLPWWTRLDQAKRPGLPFIAAPYRTLASFGDYIVFKGGLDSVVAEGRFDNNWKLPPEVAKLLGATGAIEVRQA